MPAMSPERLADEPIHQGVLSDIDDGGESFLRPVGVFEDVDAHLGGRRSPVQLPQMASIPIAAATCSRRRW
jgi:hypothetical protein